MERSSNDLDFGWFPTFPPSLPLVLASGFPSFFSPSIFPFPKSKPPSGSPLLSVSLRWMAKSNKYSSVNFNDIYQDKDKKKITTSPSPSPSSYSSSLSSTKSYSSRLANGGMLLLSRPSPSPSPSPPPPPSSFLATTPPFSLRPLPKTPQIQIKDTSPAPKTDKFVPPHLRPGYVAHAPSEFQRTGNYSPGSGHGHYGSPNRYGEDGRPESAGGYDRRIRAVGSPTGQSDLNRPPSRGSRPASTG